MATPRLALVPGDVINRIALYTLDPRPLCSASRELRAQLLQQTLRWVLLESIRRRWRLAALASQAGMTFDDLLQALTVMMTTHGADHMLLLGKLGSLLRRLEELSVLNIGKLGLQLLAAELGPDAMPRLLRLCLRSDSGAWQIGDAGISALGETVNRGALRRLVEIGE